MADVVLWLDVAGMPQALRRLQNRLSATAWSGRGIAVPLDRHTAEEVLALCCSLEVQVRRSRVVRSDQRATVRGQPTGPSAG